MTEASTELPPLGQLRTLPKGKPVGYLMAVGAALFFSVNGSVSKVALSSGLDSTSLVLLRSAGAAVCLFALVLVVEARRLRVRRGEWGLLVVYGVVGIAMVQWLYFVAIARLPVSVALLLEFTAPVLVALWARYAQHKDLGRGLWLALGLAVGGLVLVAEVWRGLTLDAVGVVAGLAAAVSLAVSFVVGEKAVGDRDTVSLAFWAFVAAAAFWSVANPWWTVPWSTLGHSVPLQGALNSLYVPVWVLVLWIVVLGTVVPFLMVIGALRHIPATRAGIVGTLEPVFAGLVAYAWLGESLAPVQVLGAVVVLIGVATAQLAASGA